MCFTDEVHNTETPENLTLPTPGCPILIAIPALGNNLPNISGMGAPVLSNLWIQPPFPHLPAHLIPGNARIQSFVPPGVSHLQTIHGEQLQLANLTACNPPISTFPQPFYAPLPPQYQTLPGTGTIQTIPRPSYPQHRLSGHSESQTTSDVGLQLGQRWPLEHPTSQPASLQGESYLCNLELWLSSPECHSLDLATDVRSLCHQSWRSSRKVRARIRDVS